MGRYGRAGGEHDNWPLAELAPLPDESANRFFARL
ncbi:hypothetical protein LDY98_33720, partial [Pseudomonas aeruginosa]|nr:hypothetical protein [Pseudomonas aeruginosa]